MPCGLVHMEQILAFLLKRVEGSVPKPVAWGGIAAIVLILLTNLLPPEMKPPVSSLIAMTISLLAAGAAVHFYVGRQPQTAAPKGGEMSDTGKPPAGKNSPPINAGRDVNIGHLGDTFIIHESMPPSVKVIDEVASGKLNDGAFSIRALLRLTTQHPPNAMIATVRKDDVVMMGDTIKTGIELTRAGGMTNAEVGQNGEYYWARVVAPTAGDYVVSIRAKSVDPKPRIQIGFE